MSSINKIQVFQISHHPSHSNTIKRFWTNSWWNLISICGVVLRNSTTHYDKKQIKPPLLATFAFKTSLQILWISLRQHPLTKNIDATPAGTEKNPVFWLMVYSKLMILFLTCSFSRFSLLLSCWFFTFLSLVIDCRWPLQELWCFDD